MLRLCFERLPGYVSLDTSDQFIDWMAENLHQIDYRFGGYIVQDLKEMWFGGNVLWTVLMDTNMELLAHIERSGWVINGYVVHAYLNERGGNAVKIDNRSFRPERLVA